MDFPNALVHLTTKKSRWWGKEGRKEGRKTPDEQRWPQLVWNFK
jgi:hypothetical protein